MTVDFSSVVEYAKVCDKLKDDSQPIYDSGLLDFEKQTMTFGSQKGFGCIPMKVEGWDGKRTPFFVKLNSLFNIAREFPVLELDGFTFKHGADGTFEIALPRIVWETTAMDVLGARLAYLRLSPALPSSLLR